MSDWFEQFLPYDTDIMIRWVALRPGLRPLERLYDSAGEPFDPERIGICHVRSGSEGSFALRFYKSSGEVLEVRRFETLAVAIDQARDLVGVEPSEWQVSPELVEERSRDEFLTETPGKTIFEGDVLDITDEDGFTRYDVQNGGWNSEPPDTWLCQGLLARFNGRRVRVTVEELGPSRRHV